MTHAEFLANRIGNGKWVVGRNTQALRCRYPDHAVISRRRYQEIETEWRALYGDPYDKVRADLYLALKTVVEKHARSCFQGDPYNYEPEWQAAINALEAERNAK